MLQLFIDIDYPQQMERSVDVQFFVDVSPGRFDLFETVVQALFAKGGNAYAVNWLLYPDLLFVWSL
jgi:hypothetical protein